MRRELNIGDEVYYTMEDYETGEDIIYKGYVIGVRDDLKLKIEGQYMNLGRFYNVSDKMDGEMIVGIQRNSLYTVKDLFDIKRKYEEIPDHIKKNLKDAK